MVLLLKCVCQKHGKLFKVLFWASVRGVKIVKRTIPELTIKDEAPHFETVQVQNHPIII